MPRPLDLPVLIIGCNRSGTTVFLRNLSAHPDVWAHYGENTDLFRDFFAVNCNRGDRLEPPPSTETWRAL